MDPLSAIGLVSSLITFVEFSWKLVSGANEIYESANGVTTENLHIANVIEDLRRVTIEIDAKDIGNNARDQPLKQLAFNCHHLSEELLEILDKLKISEKNSRWKALKVKWDSMRQRSEIVSIRDRLAEYRSEIMLHLNAMMVYVYDLGNTFPIENTCLRLVPLFVHQWSAIDGENGVKEATA
jgi:hypothetical protein